MADNSPLLKISSNLEISQSNRKNVPTENESYSMTGCPDEKPSEILPRKSMAETEIERGELTHHCFRLKFVKNQFSFSAMV